MDKTQLEEEIKKKYIFDKFNSAQELKDWAYLYLNIDLPMGHVYPDSNSSPAEALYRIYDLIKTGKTADIPQVVMVSGRDCYKTASAAVLQVLLTVHFRLSVAVMSAQKPQSEKAISYINSHFRKISKYLEGHGWKNVSDSKSRVEWIDDNGDSIYIRIVVATRSGANCILPETILHTENGKKQAKDLSKGEKVLTWDYFENKDVFVESNGIEYTKKISREIQFDDGSNVIVSDDHLCFTQRGWINAGAVRIGDTFTSNYQGQEVISQTSHSEDSQSKDLKQLLYGTLMGDSSISHNGNGKSFRYSVSHSHKQLLYLHEIQRILQQNDIRSSLCQYNKEIKGKLYTLYKLTSQVHSSFRDLRQEFYVNNKKTITGDILQNLSWEGVAYWFMDDVNGNGIITGKRKDQAYRLATCGFSIEENEIISKWFSDRGMDNSINFINRGSSKLPFIKFSMQSSRKLTSLIAPYFFKGLFYKLVPEVSYAKTVDTDEFCEIRSGMSWGNSPDNVKRSVNKNVSERVTSRVVKITPLGYLDLVDVFIKTDKPHLHSFYANSFKLLHNSEHLPCLIVDEIDLIADPQALEEAKMIPSSYRGYSPITIGLSTLKYSGGLMEKFINDTKKLGGEVYKWNIIDVTENIPDSISRPDLPKQVRYISTELPMKTLTESEWEDLPKERQSDYERIEAYAGIADNKLLPVMKNYLVDRPKQDRGGLYKKISAVRNNFNQISSDMASAQLLCKRPSSKGLVYPRFIPELNTVSVADAWEKIFGVPKKDATIHDLANLIRNLGIRVEAGVDWGYTNEYAIVVSAILPNDTLLVVDTFAAPGQELDDCVRIATEIKERWNIQTFYCDPAYPAYVKTFNRKGLRAPKFTKDVARGIEAVRGRIVDSTGIRRMVIVDTPNNSRLIEGFQTYHWKLNAKGEPTDTADHTEESDIMDATRYLCENLFGKKDTKASIIYAGDTINPKDPKPLQNKINELATDNQKLSKNTNGPRIVW